MINLSVSGDSVIFTFTNSNYYLYGNGKITVPKNSLALVTDESGFATFKKANTNDTFVSAPYSDFGMSKADLISYYQNNMVGVGVDPEEVVDIIESATSYFDGAVYDSSGKTINFYHSTDIVASIDASDFVIDGMIDNVEIKEVSGVTVLAITFNAESGKEEIDIPLSEIFNPDNYYDKDDIDAIVSGLNDDISAKLDASAITAYSTTSEVNGLIDAATSGKADSSAVTAEIAAAVSGKVDASTYNTYTATTDATLSGKLDTSAYTPTDLSQYWTSAQTESAITNAVSGKLDTSVWNVKEEVISSAITYLDTNKLDASAYTPTDLSNYWTSAQTESAINAATSGKVDTSTYTAYTAATDAALSGKQDTLSAGTGIEISGNVISATGGGSSYSAGTNISIDNDTISCTLPITGTTTKSLVFFDNTNNVGGNCCVAVGRYCITEGSNSFAQGYNTVSKNYYSHSEGEYTSANTSCSHAEGAYTYTSNKYEHTQGKYNVSSSASATFGDSGNTLFSVGNGTANNARHNAFEIRQNGDIYIGLNGSDVKLQDQLGGGITSGEVETMISAATSGITERIGEDEEVTAAALNNLAEADEVAARALIDLNDKFGGLKLQQITQSDYDALVSGGTVSNTTLYIITNVVS